MVDIKICIFILAFVLNIGIKKGKMFYSLNYIFDDSSKSEPLASLNQYIGPVYDDLGYDEDSHLRCLEPTECSWVLDPS